MKAKQKLNCMFPLKKKEKKKESITLHKFVEFDYF